MSLNKRFNFILIPLTIVLGLAGVVLLTQVALAAGGEQDSRNSERISSAASTNVIFSDTLSATVTDLQTTEMQVIVPEGAVDGDIYVQTIAGESNGAPFKVLTPEDPPTSSLEIFASGPITTTTIWDKDVLVTGDVEIASGVTLTIIPGVTVYFAAGDDQAAGKWDDKTEIMVYGTLTAAGSRTMPITFTSYSGSPAAGDWGGIVIRRGSTDSVLGHVVIQYATHGLYFWRLNATSGNYTFSVNLNNSVLQFNDYGIVEHARPGWDGGGTSEVTAVIVSNQIFSNTFSGIQIYDSIGYGTINNYAVIQNNIIENNDIGIYLHGGSWWAGHSDVKPEIRNNTIRNNTTYGMNIRSFGSGDGSGSDTDVQPVIEHNLLQNPGAFNIRLLLDPQGSDGTQILSPVIRYNTIKDAAVGILIEDTQSYDSLDPEIHHNIFYNFDQHAISNLTSRTISAEQNYWGSTENEWDLGASGWTTGTVTTSNHLDSTSAPILTRLSQDQAIVGTSVEIYGANFVAPKAYFYHILPATPSNSSLTKLTVTVPYGVATGDVIVSAEDGVSNGILFTVADLINVSGTIAADTIWYHDVLVTGDVEIASGVTLTITPGVTVYFSHGDSQYAGKWNDKSEIMVYGTLTAAGSQSMPITFTSYHTIPAAGLWGGIVIRRGSTESVLDHVVIQYATHGLYFWRLEDTSGNYLFSATLSNSLLQFNDYGVVDHARPGWNGGGTSEVTAAIINNQIASNTFSGIQIYGSIGYGTINNHAVIQNNIIENNDIGIYLHGGSWWEGHSDIKPEIRNNTIRNNTTYGMNIRSYGSGDDSGSDSDVQPIIEHNLLQNPGAINIRLLLDPQGSDGTQILNPVIRYNTITEAVVGILIEDTEGFDTLSPEIHHNILYGFEEYAISNITTRTISAEQNYWGSTDSEWNLGAEDWVTGTMTATNHLDVYSAPILTHVSPGSAQTGDTIQLYGANFIGDVAPVAAPDTYIVMQNEQLSVSAPGVLTNDSDINGDDELTAVLDSDVSNGTLHLSANGAFTYVPDTDFSGTDHFYYHATDGMRNSTSVLVSIQVQLQEQNHEIFLPMVTKE